MIQVSSVSVDSTFPISIIILCLKRKIKTEGMFLSLITTLLYDCPRGDPTVVRDDGTRMVERVSLTKDYKSSPIPYTRIFKYQVNYA